jgi:glutamate-ammonia-ligase adenylyltransferase
VPQARPWERYAWLKARALTGTSATVAELDALVLPFVYRRYHDYGAIDDIRALHAQIRAESAKRRGAEQDIKLGPGGIRELEFVAQMFQLIRGGRERALQQRSTRAALEAIATTGILPCERVARLQEAYAFLRNMEHRLQYLDDAQTQTLPSNDDDRARIADAMGFADWTALSMALDAQRDRVTCEFDALFSAPKASAAVHAAPAEDLDARCADAVGVAALEPRKASELLARVAAWRRASRTQSLSAKSRNRMEALIPMGLAASLAADGDPKATFFRLFDLLEAIDKREAYLALLVEYPAVLERVTRIAARSAFAADFLRKHPVLMDELLDAREAGVPIDWAEARGKLRAECDAAEGDVERQYEILRHTKQVLSFRLNVADLDGRLGVMALSDELTALADLLLAATLTLAARALKLAAPGDWSPPAGFAALAYGKYGSKELGYASDLDLVFVCAEQADGAHLARLAQRTLSWLNTMTAGGVLYDTDLRLRPDGDAGVLVVRLSAFADYQRHRAWLWEQQALTRARWCAGDPALQAPFDAIRAEVLSRARDLAKLRTEVDAMRMKMRADKPDRGDVLDLKHTEGGIVDVEFIVQFLILAHSHDHPELLGNLGNFALLSRAAALGLLDEQLAAGTGKAYLAYRERQHRARTNNEARTLIGRDELAAERKVVKEAWRALLG